MAWIDGLLDHGYCRCSWAVLLRCSAFGFDRRRNLCDFNRFNFVFENLFLFLLVMKPFSRQWGWTIIKHLKCEVKLNSWRVWFKKKTKTKGWWLLMIVSAGVNNGLLRRAREIPSSRQWEQMWQRRTCSFLLPAFDCKAKWRCRWRRQYDVPIRP